MLRSKEARKLAQVDSFEGALDCIELYFEKGWTDGLPVVPPTEGRVAEMVARSGRQAGEVVGPIPPRRGMATIEAIAVNAVLAGCRPEYMPVVVAAVEAMLDDSFNLNGIQATTHSAAPLVMVSGPEVKRLGINASTNAFGHGYRANATIGRAVRLVMINLGGGYPETADKATLGAPSKFTFCVGVDEESPWEAIHVERGFKREDSCVTVFGCEPPHRTLTPNLEGGEKDVLWLLARGLAELNNNMILGGQTLLALSPLPARFLASKGWSKEDVKHYLYEHARLPLPVVSRAVGQWSREIGEGWPRWLDVDDESTTVPIVRRPDNIHIVVVGGTGSASCAVLSGWGYSGGYAVTRKIRA